MTPVLLGRWQSRIFLVFTVGLVVALIFGRLYDRMQEMLVMLVYVTILGMILDIAYNELQKLRWDNDWPPIFHIGAGILEGLLMWLWVKHPIFWSQLPGMVRPVTGHQFTVMYTVMFAAIFVFNWNFMKVIFMHWRYRGGRIF